MTDREFSKRFRTAVRMMDEHKKESWVAPYLAKATPLATELETTIPLAEHAEAAWHKEAGAKVAVVEAADLRVRHWAEHLKADVHGAELGEFIVDYESVGGLDEALGKMIDAFEHRKGGKAKRGAHVTIDEGLPYAAEALADLAPHKEKLDALLLETRASWNAFREAAATKNAAKAKAWEIFKSVRRHLKADLGHSAVSDLKTPPRKPKRALATPPATPVPHA